MLRCQWCGCEDLEHLDSEFIDDCIDAMFITQKYKCITCEEEFDVSLTYDKPQCIVYA